jgi:predicted MFS family arabinose efflux permease
MSTASGVAGPASAGATSALAGLAALAVAIGVGRFAFTPLLPMMQDDAGLSVTDGAWLASANYVGYLLGALSAIGLRVRPGPAIRIGLAVISVATLAMGLAYHFVLALLLRGLAGVASAWVLVFVSAWALDRLAFAGRPDLGGAVYAGVGTGIAVAGGACLAVMGMHGSSADAWLVLGVASLVVTAAIWPSLKADTPKVPAAAPPASSERWGAGHWRLVLCYGAFGFGYIIPATFLPVMAREAIADPGQFGWAWPAFGAAALVSTLLAARLEQRLSRRTIWIAGQLAMAVGVVTPLVVAGLPGILLAAFLVGGTFMVVTMAGMQEARAVAGSAARALMAAMTSAFALGQVLGPVAVGFLAGPAGDLGAPLGIAAATLAVSAFSLMRKEAVHG